MKLLSRSENPSHRNSSQRFHVSRLGIKIALSLFVSFLVLECLLIVPIYIALEHKALNELEELGLNQVRTELVTLWQTTTPDPKRVLEATRALSQKSSIIKGLTLASPDGTPFIHFGEKPSYPMNQLPSIAKWLIALRKEQGTRYDVAWEAAELGLPYDISARLDSSNLSLLLSYELRNLLGFALLFALLLTIISLSLLRYLLISPILKLKKYLAQGIGIEKVKELNLIKETRKDEIGELFEQTNSILKRMYDFTKTIRAHEAIMKLGTDERVKVLDQITNYNMSTGLPNRNLLKELLTQYILEAQNEAKQAVVMIIELRDFHEIINVFGRSVGDQFIKESTKLLLQNMPVGGTLAHISTIRLAIARNSITGTSQIIRLAQWILDVFSKPIRIGDQNIVSTINIGIALAPNDGQDAESLLVNASLALNRAKAEAPNSFQFYESSMNQVVETRRTMLVDLHYAIEKKQFQVYYQPQVDLKTEKLIGFEALLRWQHPEKGMISPIQFIPLAEESGLITTIGEWVLQTACAQMKAWHDQGYSELGIAINLSPIQFKQKNIIEIISRILMETALSPKSVELEITESGIMNNIQEAITIMKALHNLNVTLSVDDFGTGYSSLSYLKGFPIQKLKIDQSFVKELGKEHEEKPLADIIILLGHSLNLKVIAEGVENETQLNYLKAKGCDEVQGYYYSKPVPPEDCPELFKKLL